MIAACENHKSRQNSLTLRRATVRASEPEFRVAKSVYIGLCYTLSVTNDRSMALRTAQRSMLVHHRAGISKTNPIISSSRNHFSQFRNFGDGLMTGLIRHRSTNDSGRLRLTSTQVSLLSLELTQNFVAS